MKRARVTFIRASWIILPLLCLCLMPLSPLQGARKGSDQIVGLVQGETMSRRFHTAQADPQIQTALRVTPH